MSNDVLFKPLQFGSHNLKNRIVLAPLTRGRAGPERIPNELMSEYYCQRAGAGLLISEATVISAQGNGWVNSPGIYTDAMTSGWEMINNKLQEIGTPFFLQMWHCGRASHSDFHDGQLPVSASAVKLEGDHIHTPLGAKPYETPRALKIPEIQQIVEDYRQAAIRAKKAGFTGVEIHAANGYLLNQFIDTKSNQRSDEYGGSLENRTRFLKQVLDSVLSVFPAQQIAVRLSPNGVFNDMGCQDFREIYTYIIKMLADYGLGYLHVMDGLAFGFHEQGEPFTLEQVRKIYPGVIMGNCGYTPEAACKQIESGFADLISFGRPFITNPDLPNRIKNQYPLAPYDDMSQWYGGGAEGYTSYSEYKNT